MISDCLLRYCCCVLRVFVVTMRTNKSARLFSRAQQILPGGVDSPVRAFKSVGATPLFVERGRGARLVDVDGNEFIDYVMSWGPLIHGHAPRRSRQGAEGGGATTARATALPVRSRSTSANASRR